jgi:predicted nucleic acid-binding protein
MVFVYRGYNGCKSRKLTAIFQPILLRSLYSVLTRLPVRPTILPIIAQRLIDENLNLFVAIPLTADDYQEAIACMVGLNLLGGGIFDALIAQAALKAGVDILLTLNPNHFTRLGQDLAKRVQVPS